MSWVKDAIAELSAGKEIVIYPRGGSMKGLIESGERVVLVPVEKSQLKVGDIVLCRVSGDDYLHLVKNIDSDGIWIGNNLGHMNGVATKIYGRVTQIG